MHRSKNGQWPLVLFIFIYLFYFLSSVHNIFLIPVTTVTVLRWVKMDIDFLWDAPVQIVVVI